MAHMFQELNLPAWDEGRGEWWTVGWQDVWQGPAPGKPHVLSSIREFVVWKLKAAEKFNPSDMTPSLLGKQWGDSRGRGGELGAFDIVLPGSF